MAMQNNGAEDSGVDIEQERRKADEEEEEGKILSERLAKWVSAEAKYSATANEEIYKWVSSNF